jgi:hypothetical protein
MNKIKNILKVLIIGLISIPTLVYAIPDAPPGEGGPGGGMSQGSVSYSGATEITTDTEVTEKTYSSETGSQNALLVSGGTSTLTSCSINKTGDSDGDNSDFYGTNAGILVYNGATLNIKGGTITTNGSHANAVFAYGTGIINISDTTIKTTSNNSGAIMVTGGGTLTANNVTAETDGNSSAPIRSDRGGGNLTVNGGKYTSNGTGSPAIYSTANIVVNNAELISTSSEGVVIEGANSITLNDTTLTATNTTLNGNSETYKGIFIYQSMSGDADVGTATFTSKGSKITNNKGDVIFVTNTNTVITLEDNEIVNNDTEGVFLRASTSKWGNSGSNGGTVTLNLNNQKVNGDISIDSISTLSMTMKDGSVLVGSIDKENQAKSITLSLSKDSVISLTSDTYIDSLENEDTTNSNIYSNGYKLYVNNQEVSINSEKYTPSSVETDDVSENKTTKSNNIIYYIIGGVVGVLIVSVVVIILIIRHRRKKISLN